MGCASSVTVDEKEFKPRRSASKEHVKVGDSPRRGRSGMSNTSQTSTATEASLMSPEQEQIAHERLRNLGHLDDETKIPFILVELRGLAHKKGCIEICGKDEYGVYERLENWLLGTWHCRKMDPGDLRDDTPLPFSDALYDWDGFLMDGDEGLNNMGLATMQLVDFMCNELNWTLGVINGGNVGKKGEIREQQIIFKAPHPMNKVVPHVMIELRSAGYIEVCGSDRKAMDTLHHHFLSKFGAKPIRGHEKFCTRYYQTGKGVFLERGKSGENNMGLMTTTICDDVVSILPGFSLVTINGGNYGDEGSHREQQMVFRWDNHPLRENPHMIVELREAGFIEVCGKDIEGIYEKLQKWLSTKYGCKEVKDKFSGKERFFDKKFTWASTDMMLASSDVTAFFHEQGWQMSVCSQGTVAVKGNSDSREQQILFRPGASGQGVVEPHLFIELYTGEGKDELYRKPTTTQLLGNQHIRVRGVGDCSAGMDAFHDFVEQYLGGGPAEHLTTPELVGYFCDVFLARGYTDNNLGYWTMRLCDFLVDRLGWSFVVCNVCNLGQAGQFREQQLVFRFDGERRAIPPVRESNALLDWTLFPGLSFPQYWQNKDVLNLRAPAKTLSCSQAEIQALQTMFDGTFKRALTRDRVYEYQLGVSEEMPYRLEVVHAFRCEHAELYRRFAERRTTYKGGTPYRTKTMDVRGTEQINRRLGDGEGLLYHGTNPSSAMGILNNGFVLNHAGKTTGTMFGYGVYMAECVSKSDEYSRDDNGGTYPGLMAMLVCRCLVGNPFVAQEAGDYIAQAKSAGNDCVCGDRESKVGTYKEFIFFDERQILPEYAVIYRRQYDESKVPEHLKTKATGTTGRNWQVQLEKGWTNIPPDVSFELDQVEGKGNTEYIRTINDIKYKFNLTTMEQTNLQTQKVRKLRPPFRRSTAVVSPTSSTSAGTSTKFSRGSTASLMSRAGTGSLALS